MSYLKSIRGKVTVDLIIFVVILEILLSLFELHGVINPNVSSLR